MQVQILSGIYANGSSPDMRTSYPRNMVPVPKETGISGGYLRPADGIADAGSGPGICRGGINWNGSLYRVMGTKLCRIGVDGLATVLGDVGSGGQVTLDYSFDRLAVASGGRLYYWDGATLTQVTDPDLLTVVDMQYIGGYFMTTDGEYLVVTELADPTQVNPLKYGSAETDPDPILAIDELRTEAYAFGRYSIEVYQNVGGTGFPFRRIDGAQITKGVIGTHAYDSLQDTFMFVGSGRREAPAVYQMVPGNVAKISTREVDEILAGFTEAQLSVTVVETRVDKHHQHVLIHLPDRCLVYDAMASKTMGVPVWFTLDSGLLHPSTYRARNLVWCYDRWNVADPLSAKLGRLTDAVSSHWGQPVGWEFGTPVMYAEGLGAIVHDIELVTLPGSAAMGASPVIWTSYSNDGATWSQERPMPAGRQGQRAKRIAWRRQGQLRHWRVQRFRGTSEAHLSVARLEIQIEPLHTKQGHG
jgi:hypothetical protein